MSLNTFQGIAQPDGSNCCGAFALAAALLNFNLNPQEQQADLLNTANIAEGYSQHGPLVSYTGDPGAFAKSIYQVTGNLHLDAPTATYQYLEPVADMNSPSALVYIATLFGYRPANIRVSYSNVGLAIFGKLQATNAKKALLDTEIILLNSISDNLGGGMTIVGPLDYGGRPGNTHVQIILVDNGNHWITINSTQLYDPATGTVGQYSDPAFDNGNWSCTCKETEHTYIFSGIWIELKQN